MKTQDSVVLTNENAISETPPLQTGIINDIKVTDNSKEEINIKDSETQNGHVIEDRNITDVKEITCETNDVSETQEQKLDSAGQEGNLERENICKSLSDKTEFIKDNIVEPNSQTGFVVTKDIENEDLNQRNELNEEYFRKTSSDKQFSPDFSEDKSSLPEVDGHIKEQNFQEMNSTKVNDIDVVDSSAPIKPINLELKEIQIKSEAYDNEGFVNDEVLPKVSEGAGNVDAVPSKANCSDNRKLSRRVSFSELPPKAVYDNVGFASDKLGENGGPRDGKPEIEDVDFLEKYGPGEKWRILRNVVLMSSSFMILFTAFFGAANLQSSVNAKAGLGTVSLTMVYGALIVSNIFLPVMVIRWLRCKWTVAVCALCFAPYAIAQFHAEFYTLIPTALLAGLGAGPMWCAKCTYLNVAADAFAKVTGSAPEHVMVRFFGIFYILFPLGHVWGNLISSEVLSKGAAQEDNITIDVAALCGANYCPGLGASDNPNLQRPPDYQIHTIAAIFLVCSLLAVLVVAVGVDNLSRYNEGGRKGSGTGLSGMQLLIATARLLCNRNQVALIPITAFIGMSQAFLGADFTEGYISCAWGIPHIGYVLISYGLASSIASVFVSWVVKTVGRLAVISSSITLFLILVTVLKFWQPSASQGIVFFVLVAFWGLADSTALIINAMYGLLFRGNEAAAYSNFSLWGSVGFIITYSYSPHLCMNTKLAIVSVVLILSLGGFISAELALRKIIKEQHEEDKMAKKDAGQVSIKPGVS